MRAFELKQSKNQLVIFDIDDTLLHTTAKINVIKDGRVVRSLTNQEFNNYQLNPGEEFDFGEFRDAKKFEEESLPIGPMLDRLKADVSAGHDVVMLTARADFDSQKPVWRTFLRHGIDINNDVHLYRAGNLPGDDNPAYKKAIHVNKWLKTGKYDHVTMYDDSERNLSVFKKLKKNFPGIEFEAHHVSPEGKTKQVEQSVTERSRRKKVKSAAYGPGPYGWYGYDADHSGDGGGGDGGMEESIDHPAENFIEMISKFLPLAVTMLKLKSLPTFVFKNHLEHADQPTFGMYKTEEDTLYVALMGRHPNDILRTIAHELVHYKQSQEHLLDIDSGRTGSPEENQANAAAGIIMRQFNKQHPEYLNADPIINKY